MVTLTTQGRRNKSVHKRVARIVFDGFTGWRTGFPQDFQQVIDDVRRRAAEIRGASVCVDRMISVESCAKLGLFAGINGKVGFKVTYPSFFDRRWKVVASRAFKAGFAYGAIKADGVEAHAVP